MFQQESQAAYLSASAEGATQIGLHVMVYNTLAGDLLRAAEACHKRDIPGRCKASSRALLLLGHLEAWASCLEDHALIESLHTFYQAIRQEIVRLQATGSSADFVRLCEAVQGVRGAWQAKEQELTRNTLPRQEHAQPSSLGSHAGQNVSAWCA